jgi:methyl-accepting chemotaxis protein
MSMTSDSRVENFERDFQILEFVPPLAPAFAALAYLALVVDLSTAAWWTLFVSFLLYAVASGLHATRKAEGPMQRVGAALARIESAEGADGDAQVGSLAGVCAEILNAPLEMRRRRFLTMLGFGLLVPLLMSLLGFPGWFSAPILSSFVLAIVVAAGSASMFQFYWARRKLRPLLARLSNEANGPSGDAVGVERISLTRMLQLAIAMPALATLMLTLNLVSEDRRIAAESEAIAWSRAALSMLPDQVAMLEEVDPDPDPAPDLERRVETQNRIQKSWPIPVSLAVHSTDRAAGGDAAEFSAALVPVLDGLLAADQREGVLDVVGASEVGAFRKLDTGAVLVAVVERESPASSILGLDASLGLFFAGLLAIVWGLGELVGRDLQGSIGALCNAADELARGGDPSVSAFETGDELGVLGQTLHGVGTELRATTMRVSNALDQVEQTAADAMSVVADLSTASAAQSERLQRAMDLIVSIDARGCEVSQSAEALNVSVDESSSSIAELGAAGAELNETASILSSKVDEVSNSMEQMVRSVKQVGATTEKLASASEDTSSSMEEMASAMRVVDTSAESMASLSLDVVSKAEVGQEKVRQTIEGMEAIREATDAAERVIRGLGSRTLEIGGILDVIDDVADETNLLALNAAIIAAQAGEQGKAFSVVADEIKELADRVLASTKEIGGLIRSVQEESENAIGAIEAGSQSVMSGVDLSAEAGRTLEEITDASRQNGVRIGEIVSSVREQTKAAGHVVELMERVRDSAEEIATASSEQDQGNEIIYRSALTMREVAQQVRRTTEEQSHGFGRIRESVEGVRSTVEHITGSLREQASACGDISTFLKEACEGTQTNEDAFRRLEGAMQDLVARAEFLRGDLAGSQNS